MHPSAESVRHDGGRRARRWFWALLAVAVAGTGSLSTALTARPSALTGVWFAVSSVVTTVAVILLVRIMAAFVGPGRGVRGAVSSRPAGGTPSTLAVAPVWRRRNGR